MVLKDKIKELRISRNMTQETVAQHLGVSSQTVSKWERGLLSPDISLLPKIALLFRCSIDYLFDMESAWGIEHRREFMERIKYLYSTKDFDGIYKAWLVEIELNPDNYSNYTDLMLFVIRNNMFDDEHVTKMLSFAEHAEKYCMDDDIRNEINRLMIVICSSSRNPQITKKAIAFYKKLPMLRHSREVYAGYVLEGEALRDQIKKNMSYLVDLAECSVRQLIPENASAHEKLFYYKKAAAFYEILLDGRFGGFYDIPLLCNYKEIASLLCEIGEPDEARMFIENSFLIMKKHLSKDMQNDISELLFSVSQENSIDPKRNCVKILNSMKKDKSLAAFADEVDAMLDLMRC